MANLFGDLTPAQLDHLADSRECLAVHACERADAVTEEARQLIWRDVAQGHEEAAQIYRVQANRRRRGGGGAEPAAA